MRSSLLVFAGMLPFIVHEGDFVRGGTLCMTEAAISDNRQDILCGIFEPEQQHSVQLQCR